MYDSWDHEKDEATLLNFNQFKAKAKFHQIEIRHEPFHIWQKNQVKGLTQI